MLSTHLAARVFQLEVSERSGQPWFAGADLREFSAAKFGLQLAAEADKAMHPPLNRSR
jgi:hypothetical protein